MRLERSRRLREQSDTEEALAVRDALTAAHGNVSRAADILGLSRHTLWRLVRPGGRLSELETYAAQLRTASGYTVGRPKGAQE